MGGIHAGAIRQQGKLLETETTSEKDREPRTGNRASSKGGRPWELKGLYQTRT